MDKPLVRRRIWCLVLASALVLTAFPGGAQAQDRWKELGLSGMAIRDNYDGEFYAWPGFALNFGSWHRGYGFEGYMLFLAYFPIVAGGSFVVTPSRAKNVVPYASAGVLVRFAVFDEEAAVGLNAAIGVKVALGRKSGFRAELRFLNFPGDDYEDESNLAICLGFYTAFGRRTGGQR